MDTKQIGGGNLSLTLKETPCSFTLKDVGWLSRCLLGVLASHHLADLIMSSELQPVLHNICSFCQRCPYWTKRGIKGNHGWGGKEVSHFQICMFTGSLLDCNMQSCNSWFTSCFHDVPHWNFWSGMTQQILSLFSLVYANKAKSSFTRVWNLC